MNSLRNSLSSKLFISYLVIIAVGIITLAIAAESVIPTAFNRHMLDMQQMMGAQMGNHDLADDLFTNFRTAFTEALAWAGGLAIFSAVIVSIFVSRRVVIPIRYMTRASRHIADGYYHERVPETSADELGQLAGSFNQMASTLEQTEAMRRELIGNVAHELRTPLTTIKGYMEGLIDGVLPADINAFQAVYREADRLQRIVADLQELSRVESGALELKLQVKTVSELVQTAVARLENQFEEKGVLLRAELPSHLKPVYVDEDRVGQILLNLIGNALQYTPSGGAVEVSAAVHETDVQISVTDNGSGIAAEHLPLLFTRFYRVDKSRSRIGGGSGIGLTIAKHLVLAHGGRIWAESEGTNQGSAFHFTIPIAKHY